MEPSLNTVQPQPAPMPAPARVNEQDLFTSPDTARKVVDMLGAPSLSRQGGRFIRGLPNGSGHNRGEAARADARELLEPLLGKRIVHLPYEIAGNMHRITRHLRSRGVDATSVNYYDNWLKYRCDLNLGLHIPLQAQDVHKLTSFAGQALGRFDIFHFHFAHSMLPNLQDLEELKARGKKVLFSFWGSDMRSLEWLAYQHARFLGYDPPRPYSMNMDQYELVKKINAYSDVMLGPPFIPRFVYLTGNIDLDDWRIGDKAAYAAQSPIKKDPDKVYFLHAPSDNLKKGSFWVEKLLGQCQAEGLPIETILVSGVPHNQVKPLYAAADFAVDQVTTGSFGLFSLEMMSWEIPVLAFIDEWFRRFKNLAPVINVTRKNFVERVRQCVELKSSGRHADLGRRARRWVLANRAVGGEALDQYLTIYSLLARDLPVPHFPNPAWYMQEQGIAAGVKSEFHRWMREMGVYAEMGVEQGSYDKRLYY